MSLEEALQRLNVSTLRGKQREAIAAIQSGQDVLYILPTGTGKTLVYEVSALCSPGVSVVVSPLIGLIQQQAQKLAAHGVGVLEAWDGKVWQLGQGPVKVVYCTPEQIVQQHSALRTYLMKTDVAVDRVVVDEAHVVMQWETFRCALVYHCSWHRRDTVTGGVQPFLFSLLLLRRPVYSTLASLRGTFASQFVACTATADERTRQQIVDTLGMAAPEIVSMPVSRHNMSLFVARKHPRSSEADLVQLLRRSSATHVLVFCRKRDETARMCKVLSENSIAALAYHSGMQDRETALRRFQTGMTQLQCYRDGIVTVSKVTNIMTQCDAGAVRVVCATVAFGMGLDLPDIGLVVHWDAADSFLDYVQQTGRAGRNGKRCLCITLYDRAECQRQQRFARKATDPSRRDVEVGNMLQV